MSTSSCHFTKMDNAVENGVWGQILSSVLELAMSGDVTEELGYVDRPGVQRGNLG